MFNNVSILIPTFKRSDRLPDVFRNVVKSTNIKIDVWFIIEKNDYESRYAVSYLMSENPDEFNRIMLCINTCEPCYAGAINTAFINSPDDEHYFFNGSDDVIFHEGWLEKALKVMDSDEKTMVVGTNDLLNRRVTRGEHATHYLYKREYITKYGGTYDNSHPVLYPYDHNYTDWEFIGLAKGRGVFKPCLDSVVEHRHAAVIDETYKRTQRRLSDDKLLFDKRYANYRRNG